MALTLTTGQILELVIDAFKTRLPFLMSSFAIDMSDERAKFNEEINARIVGLPTVQDYDASTGYKANAAESKSLLNDVPVTMNRHKHVPIKLDFLDQASTNKAINLIDEATMNAGFALAKSVADYCLSLALAANFSQSSEFALADSDRDMLTNIREDLNGVGCNPMGRFGIVNSAVMSALTGDSRIASDDYHGQRIEGEGFGRLINIEGFGNIWEYPDMPANGEDLTGLFGSKESIVCATRLPKDNLDVAKRLGIPQIASSEVMTDEDTGLSLLGIKWIEPGTFDIYTTVAIMYGAAAGKQGGDAGTMTDYAGHRLVLPGS